MSDIIINDGVMQYEKLMNPDSNEAFPGIYKYQVNSADGNNDCAFKGIIKFHERHRYFLGSKFVDQNKPPNSTRKFKTWLGAKGTKDLTKEIQKDGITAIIKCNNSDHNDIRGTWIHEYLFGNLCCYISARHGLLASKLLLKWNDKKNAKKQKKLKKQLKKKNKEIGQKNQEIQDLFEICRDNNIRLRRMEGEIIQIKGDIKTIIPDRAQKVQYSPNKEQIIILKCSIRQCIDEYLQEFDPSLMGEEGLKDIEFVLSLIYAEKPEQKLHYAIEMMSFFDDGYYFRVIRGQKKYIKNTITAMEKDGLVIEIFYAFNDASSVPRWRENIDQGVIKVKTANNKYTWFKLNGIDENELKQQLKDVEKQKYNISDSNNYEYLF